MPLPLPPRRAALPVGPHQSSRQGRDCELSWRITVLLLFPRLDARPGAWLMALAGVCTFVAVRALELGHL